MDGISESGESVQLTRALINRSTLETSDLFPIRGSVEEIVEEPDWDFDATRGGEATREPEATRGPEAARGHEAARRGEVTRSVKYTQPESNGNEKHLEHVRRPATPPGFSLNPFQPRERTLLNPETRSREENRDENYARGREEGGTRGREEGGTRGREEGGTRSREEGGTRGREEGGSRGREEGGGRGREEPRISSQLTEADILRSKHTMIIELNSLEQQGAKLTKVFGMYDDVEDIHFELLRQRNLVDCASTVDTWMVYIIVVIFFIEWLNMKLGTPLYFTGLGSHMQQNIGIVRIPLQRCYHRYIHRHSNSPIMDVVKAIGALLIGYHINGVVSGGASCSNERATTGPGGPGGTGGPGGSSSWLSMLPMMMKSFMGMGGASQPRPSATTAEPVPTRAAFSSGRGDMEMPPPIKSQI